MDTGESSFGNVIALVVHDLRNPAATISANVSFVKDVADTGDPDVLEALEDVEIALAELNRGLEYLAFVGRWCAGQPAIDSRGGDVAAAVQLGVRRARCTIEIPVASTGAPIDLPVAAMPLSRLVEILVRNSLASAPPESVKVTSAFDQETLVVEVLDGGPAIHESLREVAFTIDGQHNIKGRTDGRYSRAIGLVAARALADTIGARLEASGADGAACFRVTVTRSSTA